MTGRVAIVTGVSRAVGIGAAVARRLARDGFDVGIVGLAAYDERMPWGHDAGDLAAIVAAVESAGGRCHAVDADLAEPDAADRVVTEINHRLGAATALVMCHCESVGSTIHDTTIESFDRHMAVNARASWLLVRAFALQFAGPRGSGRIVGITSDHAAWNLPYGASKAAMDRIVLAAAHELAHQGITANVINPGATATGWMTPDLERRVAERTLAGRVGHGDDCANLVSFLCRAEGGWINAQLLHSDGGVRS